MEHTPPTNCGAYYQAYDHWQSQSQWLLPLPFGCPGRERRSVEIETYRNVLPRLLNGGRTHLSIQIRSLMILYSSA